MFVATPGLLGHGRAAHRCLDDSAQSRLGYHQSRIDRVLADFGRSKSELLAENALLRQQLIILRRQVKRPPITRTDRVLLVLLARLVRAWKQAFIIVQPDTLLRWHRELFRLYWKRKSKVSSHRSKLAVETITLIRQMATNNRLWGAERIRGELLKLGIRACKRTIRST